MAVVSYSSSRKLKKAFQKGGNTVDPRAIICKDKDMVIRCPVCGRKCGELAGNETIKNFRMYCSGRGRKAGGGHFFILNFPEEE